MGNSHARLHPQIQWYHRALERTEMTKILTKRNQQGERSLFRCYSCESSDTKGADRLGLAAQGSGQKALGLLLNLFPNTGLWVKMVARFMLDKEDKRKRECKGIDILMEVGVGKRLGTVFLLQ